MTKRILIIDDERDFAELLAFRLRNLNYEVSSAGSGTEGLNQARQQLPDLILLDLLLPDFDGLTLCEILRRRLPTREIPIILITAVSSEATRIAAKLAGAAGCLGKPLDFESLRPVLESVFASKSAKLQPTGC